MDFIDPPALRGNFTLRIARARARTASELFYGYLFDLRVDWGGFAFMVYFKGTIVPIAALLAETYCEGLLKCGQTAPHSPPSQTSNAEP